MSLSWRERIVIALEPQAVHAVRLTGRASGALGFGSGEGDVTLAPLPDGGTLTGTVTVLPDAIIALRSPAMSGCQIGSATTRRASSSRECSRRARYLSARALSPST